MKYPIQAKKTATIVAQGLEDDNMVLYVKANVLYESGRYDEAVRMYNRILSNDQNHTNALLMRAKTKYELGAFRGTKMDAMLYIDKAGVNKELIKLMANTELKLSNLKAAHQYVTTALELDPYDAKLYLLSGDISFADGSRNDACEHFALAANLGNKRAVQRMKEKCNGYRPKPSDTRTNDDMSSTSDEGMPNIDNSTNVEEEKKGEDGIVTLEDIVKDAEQSSGSTNRTETIDRNATHTIEIDSKLSISIGDGLGDRRLSSKPSIFMLSDQDGVVVIDLCVNGSGRVIEANFNRDRSTIFRSSLTSLALRKAKDFVFENRSSAEQCGRITYNIKS